MRQERISRPRGRRPRRVEVAPPPVSGSRPDLHHLKALLARIAEMLEVT